MNQAIVANVLRDARVLILGGAGLVGSAIARQLGRLPSYMRPSRVIVAALTQMQATAAVEELIQQQQKHKTKAQQAKESYRLKNSSPDGKQASIETSYVPAWGDIFVNHALANLPMKDRKADPLVRATMIEDLLGDFRQAYEQNHLVSMIRQHKPDIVVDCINTATIISYQNVFDASSRLLQTINNHKEDTALSNRDKTDNKICDEAENMLLSLSAPQLIRHVRFLQEVCKEQNVLGYVKIGTTGTGGMALNIPYTHSEDKPSQVLLAKTEAAFGHSGLLMLWAMTPGAPFVKELKPAAAIGYKKISIQEVEDKHGNRHVHSGRLVNLGRETKLLLRDDPTKYPVLGPMRTAVVDMGENGQFTKDEFLTITTPGQMELVSPEEISEQVVEELLFASTGHNILGSMRGALIGPGYRAGINRMAASNKLTMLCGMQQDNPSCEENLTVSSVALGKLGPPALSKLLFEAQILATKFQTWEEVAECNNLEDLAQSFVLFGEQVATSQKLQPVGTVENLFEAAISVGVPVLLRGNQLLRGPNISTPEPKGLIAQIDIPSGKEIDRIASSGWIDLRMENLAVWRVRAQKIVMQQHEGALEDWAYYKGNSGEKIDASAAAAWILAVEHGGHRDFV